ncbi:MAG: thiolase family protein [Chlamydiota bacterium]
MQTPVIIGALRTPIGSFHGGLKNIPAPLLAGTVAAELLRRTGVARADVDELILGNVIGAGLGQNPARQAAILAGIPFTASAFTVDMVCGSGLRAVCIAANAIALGESTVLIAGGAESMSRAPHLVLRDASSPRPVNAMRHDGLHCAFRKEPMGVFAETLARARGVTREEQDRYALASQQRAVEAIDRGLFAPEIVPVERDGEGVCAEDECPRRECSMEQLALLKPAFRKDGTVTAGNATPISDGAAAVLVVSEEYARARGIPPLARVASCCTAGVELEEAFAAPIPAVRKLLAKNRLSIGEIDLIEVGDSFAVEGVVCRRELGWDPARVNTRGGTLALGHPLGASGARILVTLLHALRDARKRLGLAVICLGGGNAVAMLVENADFPAAAPRAS